ncbi:hypothetical protein D3C85_1802560 [compost metagenome]
MHHGGGQPVAELSHYGQQAFVGVALMQEHRLAQFGRQGQLLFQGLLLLWSRREITVEVQPAFAHGTHPRFPQQVA